MSTGFRALQPSYNSRYGTNYNRNGIGNLASKQGLIVNRTLNNNNRGLNRYNPSIASNMAIPNNNTLFRPSYGYGPFSNNVETNINSTNLGAYNLARSGVNFDYVNPNQLSYPGQNLLDPRLYAGPLYANGYSYPFPLVNTQNYNQQLPASLPQVQPELQLQPGENLYTYPYQFGYQPGYQSRYQPGYLSEYLPGYQPGYQSGYQPGYQSGYLPGYQSGYPDCTQLGYQYGNPYQYNYPYTAPECAPHIGCENIPDTNDCRSCVSANGGPSHCADQICGPHVYR